MSTRDAETPVTQIEQARRLEEYPYASKFVVLAAAAEFVPAALRHVTDCDELEDIWHVETLNVSSRVSPGWSTGRV